jgi:signal transduction histidine kinase
MRFAFPEAAERVGWVLRLALLVLVAMLIVVTEPAAALKSNRDATLGSALFWVCLLAVAALPSWTPPRHPLLVPLGRLAETVIVALGASAIAANWSPGAASALLPYITVPVIVSALEGRLRESLALLVVAGSILLVLGAVDGTLTDGLAYAISTIEWLVIAALSAAFVHSVQRRASSAEPGPQPYAEATRLLTQLRTVARQLPGATLDPGGIAEHLIDEVRGIAPADRAAVLSGSGGGRLVVLAQAGIDRVDWETTLDADSAIADAWASQQPQVSARSQTRSAVGPDISALVVPLVAGVRTIGLVALETDRAGAFPPHVVSKIGLLAAPAALRLEAALLFDDVRSLATNEERQRLAREIHDGVAQELVMVGYGIDNALAALPGAVADTAEELRTLRAEVTRVINELRMSLFELRSEVDRQGGLTAAIAEYARAVGSSAGLRVHLSLDESTARLPAAIEAELLRIAQEAITNARKHADAQNMWVTCEVDPPYARIQVADDGAGIGPQRSDGRYGLAIMAERAERIRGQLEITPRESGGTSVAVVLGTPPRRSSL